MCIAVCCGVLTLVQDKLWVINRAMAFLPSLAEYQEQHVTPSRRFVLL